MIPFFRKQIRAFFSALMFLTRIPCSSLVGHDADSLADSCAYFPAVGIVVGAAGAVTYLAVGLLYDRLFATLCGVAATVIITGAFHEDAFADVCDGFGGWTPVRRLEIMRDSRVGSFGVVGLVLMVAAKVALLSSLPRAAAPVAFVIGHTVARWSSLVLLYRFPQVTNVSSLAGSFAATVTSYRLLAATLVTALVCMMEGIGSVAIVFLVCVTLCVCFGRFFMRWVGGISGDCLGAVNQAVELATYAVVVHAPTIQVALRHRL